MHQAVSDTNGIITSIAFSDSLNGLATVPRNNNFVFKLFPSIILRTSDGGRSWNSIPFIRPLHNLTFIPGTDQGFVATTFEDQFLAYTLDGGESWTLTDQVAQFGPINFLDTQTGWVANITGENSLYPPLMKYSGTLFPNNNPVPNKPLIHDFEIKVYPNPIINELHIESDEAIFLCGDYRYRGTTEETLSRGRTY